MFKIESNRLYIDGLTNIGGYNEKEGIALRETYVFLKYLRPIVESVLNLFGKRVALINVDNKAFFVSKDSFANVARLHRGVMSKVANEANISLNVSDAFLTDSRDCTKADKIAKVVAGMSGSELDTYLYWLNTVSNATQNINKLLNEKGEFCNAVVDVNNPEGQGTGPWCTSAVSDALLSIAKIAGFTVSDEMQDGVYYRGFGEMTMTSFIPDLLQANPSKVVESKAIEKLSPDQQKIAKKLLEVANKRFVG